VKHNIICSVISAIAFAAAFTGAQLFLSHYGSPSRCVLTWEQPDQVYPLSQEEEDENK